ncbi:MbtH family NRPS accessory protein [Streptomyces sp. NBC_00820]|uniref:MbtH family protein n=1 Tax=Streptomyces sp. NBC_00820 TaxID=2975842 RepID=UPI002ED32C93|nr:MbtH family NRPS accessory protein [Streptomyces sp. NBC_00820]
MANLFDDSDVEFVVLVNADGQYSLWPRSVGVPAGWDVAFGPGERQACLEYIEVNWGDLRPASLSRDLLG